jgi:hypothetical protein
MVERTELNHQSSQNKAQTQFLPQITSLSSDWHLSPNFYVKALNLVILLSFFSSKKE